MNRSILYIIPLLMFIASNAKGQQPGSEYLQKELNTTEIFLTPCNKFASRISQIKSYENNLQKKLEEYFNENYLLQ